jgi:histone acetyltransferase (RNA polymerase elongator complex component)
MMVDLLEIANQYVRDGRVMSIRCSTRPDYIDEEILDILEKYSVKTIELGLQSCSDNVLKITKRGHSFDDERRAAGMIVERGFDLVGQMMIGLPGADVESELETARFIINAGARAARIYPTVVFHDTELCKMMEHGVYEPISIDAAVSRSANVFSLFVENGVDVLRIGLHSSERLASEETYAAGPNHPALGELVIGEYYYKKIRDNLYLSQISENERIDILVSRGSLSKAIGQNGKNKNRLKDEFPNIHFAESDDISGYEISVITRNGEIKCT